MKKYLWSAGCAALLLAACTAKVSVETSDDEATASAPAQTVATKSTTYAEITDATTGATGLGVKAVELAPAEAISKTMEFLKGSMPFFVATVEQGLPRVRPTGVVTFFQDKIWFHVGQSKGVYQQILQDPHVEIVSVGKDREWIRISGEATCVDDEAVSNQALDARPHLKSMYNEKTGQKLGNFYFEHALVELSKADGTVEMYKW